MFMNINRHFYQDAGGLNSWNNLCAALSFKIRLQQHDVARRTYSEIGLVICSIRKNKNFCIRNTEIRNF